MNSAVHAIPPSEAAGTLALPRMAVAADGLTKRFGRLEVLRGVDLAVRPGRVTALLGPNAAGKSTFLKLLLGLARPDQGSLTVYGTPVGAGPDYRMRIGYMPQQARFPENLTGREVVRLLRDLRGDEVPEDDELFGAFDLAREMDKPVRTLSGGTRQKLNAATAFMFRPSLLVLDEPTAGLDPIASGVLKEKIARARDEGASVLLTSHVLSELDELADDVIVLLDGRVEYQGSLRRLRETTAEARLERAIARLMQRRRP